MTNNISIPLLALGLIFSRTDFKNRRRFYLTTILSASRQISSPNHAMLHITQSIQTRLFNPKLVTKTGTSSTRAESSLVVWVVTSFGLSILFRGQGLD